MFKKLDGQHTEMTVGLVIETDSSLERSETSFFMRKGNFNQGQVFSKHKFKSEIHSRVKSVNIHQNQFLDKMLA